MSADGKTVRNLCVPGLTVQHLCQWLSSRPPSPHIRQVTFHVGINNCSDGPVSATNWVSLIRLLRRVFPNALLHASSILPPISQQTLKEAASLSTSHLRRSCHHEGVVYIDHTPSFLAKSGAPKKAMYQDRIHPSALGCKALALNIRYPGNHQRPSPVYRSSPSIQKKTSPHSQHLTNRPSPTVQGPPSPHHHHLANSYAHVVSGGKRREGHCLLPTPAHSSHSTNTKPTDYDPDYNADFHSLRNNPQPPYSQHQPYRSNSQRQPVQQSAPYPYHSDPQQQPVQHPALNPHHSNPQQQPVQHPALNPHHFNPQLQLVQQPTSYSQPLVGLLAEILKPYIKY